MQTPHIARTHGRLCLDACRNHWSQNPNSELRRIMMAVHAGRGRAQTLEEIAVRLAGPDESPRRLAPRIAPCVWWLERHGYLGHIDGPWWARRYVARRLVATWPAS